MGERSLEYAKETPVNGWALFPVSVTVLYLGGKMLKLVFHVIDLYSAANPRNNGGKQAGRSGDC